MKIGFLIRFKYDYYCQGYEEEYESMLVYASTYEEACEKIKNCTFPVTYNNPRQFINLTLY
jgi:hypothetical protein